MTDTREIEIAKRSERRMRQQINDAIRRSEVIGTPAGQSVAKRSIDPLVRAMKAWLAEALEGGPGRRAAAAVILKDLNLEVCAYLTIREVLTAASQQLALRTTAINIANRIEDELIGEELSQEEPHLLKSIERTMRQRGAGQARIAGAVRSNAKGRNRQLWTKTTKIRLGCRMVEFVVEELGIIRTERLRIRPRIHKHLIRFTPKIEEWLREYNDAYSLVRPFHLPLFVPPKPWDGPVGGGYHTDALRPMSLITQPIKARMELVEGADMPIVYEAVNTLQEVPWQINSKVLEVMKEAWERDLRIGAVPPREDEPIPESPPEVINDVKGGIHRKRWRMQVREIYERNAKNKSARFEFGRLLMLGTEHASTPFYFPYRLDFRGRIYAASTSLNPQGADEARGLLQFATGKPLGELGMYWLGVHGANLFGEDKISLDDRFQWASDHRLDVQAVARDPLGFLWWTEADKPWQFLAWCFEWAEAHSDDFVSHLPIQLDGSCNGLQHFSAMLRDPVGGAAVNLVPGQSPSDIYQRVADRTMELLKAVPDTHERYWEAQSWIQWGVDRKTTKRPVMVLPYGGTYASCIEYVRQAVREQIADGAKPNPFGRDLPKATAWLSSFIWAAIRDTVVAAKEAMGWLQTVAKVCATNGYPIVWRAPTGFPVYQGYKDVTYRRVRTRFAGSLVFFVEHVEQRTFHPRKNALALSPNFVHSLDAAALMTTVVECKRKGITNFLMIHDSYGTHACDTDELAKTLRDVFIQLYEEHDVLAEFRSEILSQIPEALHDQIPPVPEKGSLDLSLVRDSLYFFA